MARMSQLGHCLAACAAAAFRNECGSPRCSTRSSRGSAKSYPAECFAAYGAVSSIGGRERGGFSGSRGSAGGIDVSRPHTQAGRLTRGADSRSGAYSASCACLASSRDRTQAAKPSIPSTTRSKRREWNRSNPCCRVRRLPRGRAVASALPLVRLDGREEAPDGSLADLGHRPAPVEARRMGFLQREHEGHAHHRPRGDVR